MKYLGTKFRDQVASRVEVSLQGAMHDPTGCSSCRASWLYCLSQCHLDTSSFISLPRRPPYKNVDTVVVADFTNSTDVPELGRPGPFYDEEETDVHLLDAMMSALKLRPTVRVLSADRVDETLKQMNRKPDEPLTPELAREVCLRPPCKAVLRDP